MVREGLKELKTWPGPFNEIWEGNKTAELRRDDRRFQVGDIVHLVEHDPNGVLNGRRIIVQISHMLQGGDFPGLVHGFVIFSFRIRARYEANVYEIRQMSGSYAGTMYKQVGEVEG